MRIQWSTLKNTDIQKIIADATAELERREKVETARAQVQEKLKEIMSESGLTMGELASIIKPEKAEKAKVAPKYADGQGNTWTGRGRQPAWVAAALAAGATLESLAIQTPSESENAGSDAA